LWLSSRIGRQSNSPALLQRRSFLQQLLLELGFGDHAFLYEELGYSIRHSESEDHKLG
jgi:hypothetical protein